ncbi:MAG: helix-turn-helix transcriptional regulator [Lachnospiraceae bacterium]|nr:helix-turn-helix transcriptional regulator [Lachnospiraceae bacterium]
MYEDFIADRITELRLKKDVSEYKMSLDLGRNKTYIQSITSGRNFPKMQHFFEICDYFGVTPYEFFDPQLHHIPLYHQASDLLKELDEDDLLAIISILRRLASKNN